MADETLIPLRRDDVPAGLVFTLGYQVVPGSRLVFLRSSDARQGGGTRGAFHAQSVDSLAYIQGVARRVDPSTRIAKTRRYMTSGRGHRTPETLRIWNEAFSGVLPASTALEVPGSPLMGSVIDLEAWAVAPADVGGEPLFRLAGPGLLPEAAVVRGDQSVAAAVVKPQPVDSVEGELRSCLERIDAEFARLGAGEGDVAKLTAYFRDPRSWDAIQAMVYTRYGDASPVLNPVIVSNLSTPGGHVELTGWARVDPERAGDGAVSLADRIFALTGTGAIRIFLGGEAPQMYAQKPAGSIEEQAHIGMENQEKVLAAAGATFDDVFRSNFYITDMRDWEAIEPIVIEHFGRKPPRPMVVEVSRLTAKQGVHFEPDLWAVRPAGE